METTTTPKCEFCGNGFDAQNPNAGVASRDYHYACFNRQGYLDGISIKKEQQRKQRNANSRARYQAMRSLGMVKTPYGWE